MKIGTAQDLQELPQGKNKKKLEDRTSPSSMNIVIDSLYKDHKIRKFTIGYIAHFNSMVLIDSRA